MSLTKCTILRGAGPVIFIGDLHFRDDDPAYNKIIRKKYIPMLKRLQPLAIFLLGDVFHHHGYIRLHAYWEGTLFVLACARIAHTVVLVGNHDMGMPITGCEGGHVLLGFSGRPDITLVDRPTRIRINGTNILACPYYPAGSLRSSIAKATGDLEGWLENTQLVVAHQEIRGVKMGSGTSMRGDQWDETLPMMISGHIHTTQRVGNVYYPGCAKNFKLWLIKDLTNLKLKYMTLMQYDPTVIHISDDDSVSDLVEIISQQEIHRLHITGPPDKIREFKKTDYYSRSIMSGIDITFSLTMEDSSV